VEDEAGGFEQWKAGYGTTISSNPQNLAVGSVGAGQRTVAITLDLHATDVDP
jgi:hypothetical protein